ncbi:HPr family phosphocarrier protein [Kurthia senegalensis]|uniref:HPr family phosphocarrier protein n=1 Tax=Kurthia senegalensis TaxID=1033740 RepID=UPI000289AC2F|nr:HPr family phosphocarrier protein [Kurthia senegalensis]
MISKQFTITAPEGLHARPAAELVKAASKFQSDVSLVFGEKDVNLKSILGVMSLGVPAGSDVTINVNGSDEELAFEKIAETFTSFNLGEQK